ncbi:MAG: hypothetical protein IKF91_06160 [Bacilli bacterium]|nr:hypothetical protein [Bacilli bacterium]
MKISKGKIILAIVVIYFTIFAFININKEKDMNKDILDNVVYVTDGVVNPKNEGKLVLVSGKIDYDNLVGFLELENFSSIKVNRKVEDYVKIYDEDNNEYEYKWVERKESLENNDGDYLKKIISEEKVSSIKIGDFELDEKGLSLIPADKYYSKQEKVGDLITKGIYYSRDPDEENLKEGDIKITYKYYDLDKNPYLSVLAVQKGNSFVPYKVDKKKSFYQVFTSKVDSKKKLTKELELNVKRTKKGKFLFIVMIIGVGIFFIIDNKSSKQGV